jgi:hypothetical protein
LLLSDRIVMMTNGPAATIGGIVEVGLPRPRDRLALATNARYIECRREVLEFLYSRQARKACVMDGGRLPRLVVVGNGMAGVRAVEELIKLSPGHYDITVFGAEPHPNYNRILLSPVLAGEQTLSDIVLNASTGTATTASGCTWAGRS